MKITKRQLKRIIKEEKRKLEEVEYYGDDVDFALKDLMSILRSMDVMERNSTIYDIIDQLEELVQEGQ